MSATILLYPQSASIRNGLAIPLEREGCRVVNRAWVDVVEAVNTCAPDLVILRPAKADEAADMARKIRRTGFGMPILCLREGALVDASAERCGDNVEFVPPPHRPELIAARVLESLSARLDRNSASWPADLKPIVGISEHVRGLRDYLPKLAASDCSVLVTGETGTGKELVAESIHRLGPRRDLPWIALNCATLPDSLAESELFGFERGAFTGASQGRSGKFEMAQNGSIFLDEIGELPLRSQAKLLRVLESRETTRIGGHRPQPVRARVIAATNQEADRLVREGYFRADLFYRLNVVRIHVPPLRERPEDVPLLLDHLARGQRPARPRLPFGFTAEAIEALTRYPWPGNVREIRNLVESLAVLDPQRPVCEADLPAHLRLPAVTRDTRALLASTLASTNWNKSETARRLQWSRMTVYRNLRRFKLNR
jgi:DNA-binding NtrC family response regulator